MGLFSGYRTQEYLAEQNRVLNRDYEEWKKRKEDPLHLDSPNRCATSSVNVSGRPNQVDKDKGKDNVRWAKELKSLLGIRQHPNTVVNTKSGYCTGLFFGGEYEIGELIRTVSDGWFYEVSDGKKKLLMKQLKSPMIFVRNALLCGPEDPTGPSSSEILDLVFNFGNGVFGFLYPSEEIS